MQAWSGRKICLPSSTAIPSGTIAFDNSPKHSDLQWNHLQAELITKGTTNLKHSFVLMRAKLKYQGVSLRNGNMNSSKNKMPG
ncbi:hypothetical protein L195_g049448 [Trifolium pratense]|uniref:Uncharacterized protein n=1 Tax=Trifolium pratense TaxID=57577 RepID=A0A2K3JP59_TRIPR|nr:hypothetical protein L195_g049448 [Trifolium pratense]